MTKVDFTNARTQLPPGFPRMVVGGAIVILAGILLSSAVYTIDADEAGVILRFGRHSRTVDPGIHLMLPFGIDRVVPVPIQRKLKEEFGFRTAEAAVRSTYKTEGYEEESLMLTGDLNMASVEWIVQYQINDPVKFLFNVRDVRATLKAASEAVMREVVGDRSVNEVLTTGRAEIGVETTSALQTLMNQYGTGVDILLVQLQSVTPPDPVKPSFNEVNQAEQERERLINEAEAEYQKAIPRARGESQQIVQTAEGYASERINMAEGDAKMFIAIQAAYAEAPEVTRKRLYLESMRVVIPKTGRKIIIDTETRSILPHLDLNGKEVAE